MSSGCGRGRDGSLTEFCSLRTFLCMRTTLDFDERLLREAKKRAAESGVTLTALIESSLRAYLQPKANRGKKYRLQLIVKKGRPVPGVNWDDRDSIYERMEGRS